MPKVVPEYKTQARAAIVKAAVAVFHEKGLGDSTMEDIARRVGVSKGALYLYFPSKAALLRAVQSHTREKVFERMTRLLDDRDPAAGLVAIVDEIFRRNPSPAFWNSLLAEASSDPEIRAALQEDSREDARALRKFLLELRARGKISATGDLEATLTTVTALLESCAAQYMMGADPTDIRRRFVRALRHTLDDPSPRSRGGSVGARRR